ncbi:glycosyltransferase family 4 protein [Kamptonema cortianum]|uniref:Glycosyltransferase family 4 protein n=1 Tax=Geitlerinema calcuttense NRMC-F 0142 TaxID=2922238 RepID=A0ABT7M030_9CYAN|nr:glycosyltransferase family 4 protein [Geitlerinema calcuttense]MDK3160137.1 glycosyltransferase family 4 protein [Kamptonema cortianum]MDL5057613.1 glycosyltransferase family 4 protein [Geitlerinema calcuttense NRMC-F 0142]
MNSPQPILIATLMREQGETGVQTYFNMLRDYLVQIGRETAIITPFSYFSWLVIPVFALRKLIDPLNGEWSVWWYRYWHYFFLKQALKQSLRNAAQPGINPLIYAQCPLSAKAALEVRQNPQQKVVMVVHFNVSQAEEWAEKGKIQVKGNLYRTIQELEEKILPQLDGIVYVSQFMQSQVETRIPATQSLNKICLPCFIAKPTPLNSLEKKRDLINIGTLEPRKNQAYLLEVLAAAKKQGFHYSLSLVGDGSDRAKLAQLADTLGITEQVKFWGFQPQASQLLASHRLYVHSAKIDNLPISLLEALASGLPVLAGDVGGISEIFNSGVEGYFWTLDNPEFAAKQLIEILENKSLYQALSQAAESRFHGCFETAKIVNKLLLFFDQISLSQSKLQLL